MYLINNIYDYISRNTGNLSDIRYGLHIHYLDIHNMKPCNLYK